MYDRLLLKPRQRAARLQHSPARRLLVFVKVQHVWLHATADEVAYLPVRYDIVVRQPLQPAQHIHLPAQVPGAIEITVVFVNGRFALCAHILILHVPTVAATAQEVRRTLVRIE